MRSSILLAALLGGVLAQPAVQDAGGKGARGPGDSTEVTLDNPSVEGSSGGNGMNAGISSEGGREGGSGNVGDSSNGSSGSDTYTQGKAASAAPFFGNIGYTTVSGDVERSFSGGSTIFDAYTIAAGEDIFGPLEAGFTSTQDFILAGFGCATGKGYVAAGIDTATATRVMEKDCDFTVPRYETDDKGQYYVGFLNACGGHTSDFHFHQSMNCLYDETAAGHSTMIGLAVDGHGIYGMYESYMTLPTLDACGAHWGMTPSYSDSMVYHYHVQEHAPFTVGCFGPNADNSLVTVAQCRALYDDCQTEAETTLTVAEGTIEYDLFCPCWDAANSNVGANMVEIDLTGAYAPSADYADPSVVDSDSSASGDYENARVGGSTTTEPCYVSPNTKKCMPMKQLGSYCNAVQKCANGLDCVANACQPQCAV